MHRFVLYTLVSMLLFSLPLDSFGKHGQEPSWLNDLRDARGHSCCGTRDCVQVEYIEEVKQLTVHETMVEVGIADRSGTVFHPMEITVDPAIIVDSKDAHAYICMRGYYMESVTRVGTCKGDPSVDPVACIACLVRPKNDM